MDTEHRYKFEKSSKKHNCPECSKNRFVRYIDTETGEYLPTQYGRCDRESKCGYYLNPYSDGYFKAIKALNQGESLAIIQPSKPRKTPLKTPEKAFIPIDIFNRTRAGYEKNIFIQNLLKRVSFPFDIQDIEKVISTYHLGTIQNGYRTGANTFPFIDSMDNIRAIQVKQFDKTNHTTGTDFIHSIIEKHHNRKNKPLPEWLKAYKKNELKVSCLFGEHLLSRYPHNPIALVEAPKTAIYGTLYLGFPDQPKNLLWLAVYNLSSLNLNKCKALKGRSVYLFPDLSKNGSAFKLWSKKATEIQKDIKGTSFIVSDLLEKFAPDQDKEKGKDIADYLINQDWRLFRKQEIKEVTQQASKPIEKQLSEKGERLKKTFISSTSVENTTATPQNKDIDTPRKPPDIWSDKIAVLKAYFDEIKPPSKPVRLNKVNTIADFNLFIESHFETVKANKGKKSSLPYFNRLQQLKEILTSNIL